MVDLTARALAIVCAALGASARSVRARHGADAARDVRAVWFYVLRSFMSERAVAAATTYNGAVIRRECARVEAACASDSVFDTQLDAIIELVTQFRAGAGSFLAALQAAPLPPSPRRKRAHRKPRAVDLARAAEIAREAGAQDALRRIEELGA